MTRDEPLVTLRADAAETAIPVAPCSSAIEGGATSSTLSSR
jgi:hypothetical protein